MKLILYTFITTLFVIFTKAQKLEYYQMIDHKKEFADAKDRVCEFNNDKGRELLQMTPQQCDDYAKSVKNEMNPLENGWEVAPKGCIMDISGYIYYNARMGEITNTNWNQRFYPICIVGVVNPQQEIAYYKQENQNLLEENEKLKKEISKISTLYSEALVKISKLEQDIRSKDTEIEKIKNQSKDVTILNNKITKLEQEVTEKNKQILNLNLELKKNLEQITNLKSELLEKEKKIQELENNEQIQKLNKEIETLKQNIASKDKQIQEIELQLKAKDELIKKLENSTDDKKTISDLHNEITTLKKEIELKNQEMEKSISTLNEMKKNMNDLENLNKANKIQIEDLKNQLLKDQKSLDKLNETINMQNKKIKELQMELGKENDEISQMSKILDCKSQNDKLNETLDQRKTMEIIKTTLIAILIACVLCALSVRPVMHYMQSRKIDVTERQINSEMPIEITAQPEREITVQNEMPIEVVDENMSDMQV